MHLNGEGSMGAVGLADGRVLLMRGELWRGRVSQVSYILIREICDLGFGAVC